MTNNRVQAVCRRFRSPSLLLAAFTAVFTAAAPAAILADDPQPTPKVTIDLKPNALLQGHDLRATIRVSPESGNRLLSVKIDAPTFFASTERELTGAAAQRTHVFNWQKLPAGDYMIEARVTGADGVLFRVERLFTVHGLKMDGETETTTVRRRGRRGL